MGGAPGRVLVYPTDNTLVADFAPCGAGYIDPVNVAVGHINGDGVPDLVRAATAGNPDVRVYSGQHIAAGRFDPTGSGQRDQFFAYGTATDTDNNGIMGSATILIM